MHHLGEWFEGTGRTLRWTSGDYVETLHQQLLSEKKQGLRTRRNEKSIMYVIFPILLLSSDEIYVIYIGLKKLLLEKEPLLKHVFKLISSAFYIDLVFCVCCWLPLHCLQAGIWDTLGIFVPSNTTNGQATCATACTS